ncbi:flagellar export chaperone FliS [Thermotalea metallivorans]|uniref:Flagellar protein FliS n=1 Tax=Thermotalea metallivorans TaxID=520762 RepID=A0A140L729_9FIRM|nr:flagellar export chaperone FliS [Thermotalea metallivorans]KXG76354.1 Flagellar protein FliS [Thermotalea metallivorans]
MALNNPYAQYKQNTVMTAPPEELTLMLFEGMVKFINQSKLFMQEKKLDKASNANLRAQDIIAELNLTLNMKYDISKNLRTLYDYMSRRLIEANLKKDVDILEEVLGLATELRDTWKEAIKIARKG